MNEAQTKSLSETNPSKIDWRTTRIRQQYMVQKKKFYTKILSISCFEWDESYHLILVSCDVRFLFQWDFTVPTGSTIGLYLLSLQTDNKVKADDSGGFLEELSSYNHAFLLKICCTALQACNKLIHSV